MKHLFLPYRLALLAKEKGFNEKCFAIYDSNKKVCPTFQPKDFYGIGFLDEGVLYQNEELPIEGPDFYNFGNKEKVEYNITAPLYQQIIDWFDSKGIYIQVILIEQFRLSTGWGYELTYSNPNGGLGNTDEDEFYITREGALNNAIEKALKLI